MKSGIVIYPYENIQTEINNLRKRYDPEYPLIKPHITLKTRFDIDKNSLKILIDELVELTKNIETFKINIKKINSFQPIYNKIYFKIKHIDKLKKIYNDLYKGIVPKEKFTTFVPHITIAQNLNPDEFVDIYTSLSMQKNDFEDTINQLNIVYELADGTWKTYKSFTLGG